LKMPYRYSKLSPKLDNSEFPDYPRNRQRGGPIRLAPVSRLSMSVV
jgi:hypothetical protein